MALVVKMVWQLLKGPMGSTEPSNLRGIGTHDGPQSDPVNNHGTSECQIIPDSENTLYSHMSLDNGKTWSNILTSKTSNVPSTATLVWTPAPPRYRVGHVLGLYMDHMG